MQARSGLVGLGSDGPPLLHFTGLAPGQDDGTQSHQGPSATLNVKNRCNAGLRGRALHISLNNISTATHSVHRVREGKRGGILL